MTLEYLDKRKVPAPKEDPIVCSICGFPETKENPVVYAGMFTYVKLPKMRIGQMPLWICKSCSMGIDEINEKGEVVALGRKGQMEEHR